MCFLISAPQLIIVTARLKQFPFMSLHYYWNDTPVNRCYSHLKYEGHKIFRNIIFKPFKFNPSDFNTDSELFGDIIHFTYQK